MCIVPLAGQGKAFMSETPDSCVYSAMIFKDSLRAQVQLLLCEQRRHSRQPERQEMHHPLSADSGGDTGSFPPMPASLMCE